jgi:hypothetical protein
VRTLAAGLLLSLLLAGCLLPAGKERDCATARARAARWQSASMSDRSVVAGDIEFCGVLKGRDLEYVRSLLGEPSRMEAGRWIYFIQDGSPGQGWLRVAYTGTTVSSVSVQGP